MLRLSRGKARNTTRSQFMHLVHRCIALLRRSSCISSSRWTFRSCHPPSSHLPLPASKQSQLRYIATAASASTDLLHLHSLHLVVEVLPTLPIHLATTSLLPLRYSSFDFRLRQAWQLKPLSSKPSRSGGGAIHKLQRRLFSASSLLHCITAILGLEPSTCSS